MNPSYDQLNDYTQYLQSQVQKFTAFMLTQKKLNQKHIQVEEYMKEIFVKLNRVEQKIKVIEVNEKDSLLELRKIRAEKEAVKMMELRLENIQRELSSILKLDSNHSFQHGSDQSSMYQRNSLKSQRNKSKKKETQPNYHKKDLSQIQKYLVDVFVKRQEAQSMINMTKNDLQFRIKKLQIQIDKSKQSFLKLTNHISTLSNLNNESLSKRELKHQNRVGTESTKDLNIEPMNQQNVVTKKQLRKMEKKLQNFFSQKLSQITTKNQRNQQQTQSLSSEKALKFKKIQQKYDRMTHEHTSPRQTRSQRKIDLSDRQYSSQKKISLFDNEMLKEKHMNQMNVANQRKNQKSKSRNNKQSPIGMLDSPKYAKQRRTSNSKSQVKKLGKKRSPQRMKKVNLDYMMH